MRTDLLEKISPEVRATARINPVQSKYSQCILVGNNNFTVSVKIDG
jgi:hypothetical protein